MVGVPGHVLITGIGGFTGRYMAATLRSRGYRVSGIGRQPGNEDGYRQVDLADKEALRRCLADLRPEVVLHLAAVAFVGHEDAEAFYRVNLLGTRNLLEVVASMSCLPECVLLASSANVYGNASGLALSEQSPLAPANEYAVSKMAMEAVAQLWMERLPLIITRPFNYTGVGQSEKFLLPKIVAHFQRKAPHIELGNLDVYRDFTDVRALAQAYCLLIESGAYGEVVNVCSGTAHSLREVLEMCERVTGHRLDVQVNPELVRANEVKRLCGDASRLRKLIPGWQTPPLEHTLRWMLAAE